MKHVASPQFWDHYHRLPRHVRHLADRNFALLKRDPRHPSLRFKKVASYWSARVGSNFRALAAQAADGTFVWFWIGPHDQYDHILGR